MKAISLWQPWASLVSWQYKQYETRHWYTNYRGELAICAAKKNTKEQKQIYEHIIGNINSEAIAPFNFPEWSELPFGRLTAVVDMVDCIKMTEDVIEEISFVEHCCGNWDEGRFAWKFENIRPSEFQPLIKGSQGFFDIQIDEFPDKIVESKPI